MKKTLIHNSMIGKALAGFVMFAVAAVFGVTQAHASDAPAFISSAHHADVDHSGTVDFFDVATAFGGVTLEYNNVAHAFEAIEAIQIVDSLVSDTGTAPHAPFDEQPSVPTLAAFTASNTVLQIVQMHAVATPAKSCGAHDISPCFTQYGATAAVNTVALAITERGPPAA